MPLWFASYARLLPARALTAACLAYLVRRAAAQAPVNDIVSWPSGMLLLASVLYAGLGNSLDKLWSIEPANGLCLFNGLPVVNLRGMNRANWVYKACHFISHVRPAVGRQSRWVPAEQIGPVFRDHAFQRAQKALSCVTYAADSDVTVGAGWERRPTGMMYPLAGNRVSVAAAVPVPTREPSTRDYLLFAALGFVGDVEPRKIVTVYSSRRHNIPLFSTRGSPGITAIIDVDSIEMAEMVVAANIALHEPHETRLRALATRSDNNVLLLDIDMIGTSPVCTIDFHSYAPPRSKVSATLRELAESYYVVKQYIKTTRPTTPAGRPLAQIHCHGSLWTAILGGEWLANGRLTVQYLPHEYMSRSSRELDSSSQTFVHMVDGIVHQLELANAVGEEHTSDFDAIIDRGGISRASSVPFFLTGILCQAIVCYFLSVGTSAGIWTSVAMANALFTGRLTDLHSMWCSRRTEAYSEDSQPGLKMRLPGTEKLMVIATLNRSAPAHAMLRPGFLLNIVSFVAAILGSIFQAKTRAALGFGAFQPAQEWVLYAAIGMALVVPFLLLAVALRHWITENSWRKWQDMPDRIIVLSTVPASLLVSALAIYFHRTGQGKMWPILDAVTFVSGLPLGLIENGDMVSVDENMVHLVLFNRWVMGAVASSLGRGAAQNVTA